MAVRGHDDLAAAGGPCVTWKCAVQAYDCRCNTLGAPDNGAIMTPLRRLAPAAIRRLWSIVEASGLENDWEDFGSRLDWSDFQTTN